MTTPTEELDDLIEQRLSVYSMPNTDKKLFKIEVLQALATTLRGLQMPEKLEYHDLNPRPFNSEDWVNSHNVTVDQCQAVIDALIAELEAV